MISQTYFYLFYLTMKLD